MDKAMMAAMLRQEKREAAPDTEAENESAPARSPRYDMEAREAEADELEAGGGQAQQKREDDGVGMLNAPSAGALRWSWLAIIPSFGLSLIYTNLHAFMRLIFPKFFCELGSEWFVGPAKVMGGGAAGQGVKMGEKMLLAMIDLVVLMVILVILAVIMILVDAASGIMGWVYSFFV